MPRRCMTLLFFICLVTVVTGLRDAMAADVSVSSPWSRATPPGIAMGAAYLTLSADIAQGDRLLGVSSASAERVEVHSHSMQGGKVVMKMLREVAIPAGKTVAFKPGGYHLMLIGLRKPLTAGSVLTLILRFSIAGSIRVNAPIMPIWSLGPDAL